MARWLAIFVPLALAAGQSQAQQPLSAIDWLNDLPPTVQIPPQPPLVTQTMPPDVTVEPLEAARAPVGLVSGRITGLSDTLWQGSDPATVARAIADVSVSALPAARRLLFTLLLTEARATGTGPDLVLEARARRLMAMGAADPAFALLEVAQPLDDPGLVAAWFDAGLLVQQPAAPCHAIRNTPHLSPGYAASVFCAARMGHIAAATVMFDGARSLGLMSPEEEDLLDRLLHPEFFEDATPLSPPEAPTPLIVTLRAAIAEPLSATALPRAFAVIDLHDVAGWKAQLDAAERLGRSGALTGNGLLGVYTARMPAASGGVWDRVAAVQKFETALFSRDQAAVAETLPKAWDAMHAAGLTVTLADVFAPDLESIPMTGEAGDLALRFLLLSDRYETAATMAEAAGLAVGDTAFLTALARGLPGSVSAQVSAANPASGSGPQRLAITDGFAPMPALPPRLDGYPLGETILKALDLLDSGARGNLGDLTDALLGLRALGLEDVARRAALQLVILGPQG